MTRKEIIDGLKFTVDMFLFNPSTGETYTEPRNDMDKTTIDACKGAIELLEQTRWIPIKKRPLTDEELRYYYDNFGNDMIPEYMLDCPLPENGQEILITFQMGNGKRIVAFDTCGIDEWGHYLEDYDDFDCVIAWMPLPEPYKAESEEEE